MNLQETVLATGTLHACKTVEVGAQVSGQLKKLHVELGDRVRAGDLLAEIDPVLQENSLKEALAEKENIEAQIRVQEIVAERDRLEHLRQQELLSGDATSQADFEVARAQYQTSVAELGALRAQLKKTIVAVDSAKANLGYTKINAPMDGMVVNIDADEGQTLVSAQTASTILTLADTSRMTVKAEISEADITQVQPGQNVYFTTLGDPDRRHEAKLRAIEPSPTEEMDGSISTSSTAVYYNGLFDVDNSDGRLRVGMTAEVTVILKQAEQALAAPIAVLRETNPKQTTQVDVLVNGHPQPRQVKLGLNDKVHVQFLDGVVEGEQLILHTVNTDNQATQDERPKGPFGGGPPPGGGP